MSDFSPDFGQDQDSPDVDLDLDFGPESVEAMPEYVLIEQGIYDVMATNVDIARSKEWKELMVVVDWAIDEEGEFGGKMITDRLVLPGKARKKENPRTWNTMMDMFRRKVEAITGQQWREDNMKLNPRQDILGRTARIAVVHEASAYEKNGIRKVSTNAVIAKYLKSGEKFIFPDTTLLAAASTPTTPSSSGQSGGSHV